MVAGLIGSADNRYGRVGARVHDVTHPAWRAEVDVLLDEAGDRIAFLTLPKAERAADVERFLDARRDRAARRGLRRADSGQRADRDARRRARRVGDRRAARRRVASTSALMDFVSAHHGAIPLAAMESPGQFDHPLVRRAKCEIAAAALAHGVVPAHNVTRALDDPTRVHADARRARDEFGFLRMWSIHPSQIEPIVDAMQPAAAEVDEAAAILAAAQAADWAPLRIDGELHDRASYRQAWTVLQRAHAAGVAAAAARGGVLRVRRRRMSARRRESAAFERRRPCRSRGRLGAASTRLDCSAIALAVASSPPPCSRRTTDDASGQWEMTSTSTKAGGGANPPSKTTMCTDAAMQKEMIAMGAGMSKDMCTKNDFKRDGATGVRVARSATRRSSRAR